MDYGSKVLKKLIFKIKNMSDKNIVNIVEEADVDINKFNLYKDSSLDQSDIDHIKWIYLRLINVYNENPKVDYMVKFNNIIERI